MEANDLLGFKAKHTSELQLNQVVARVMKYAHVAYIARGEGEASGYFFKHSQAESALGSVKLSETGEDGLLDLKYDGTNPNEKTIKELNNSKTFPARSVACGIFLRKRVFLQTWPISQDTVYSPVVNLKHERKEVSIKFAHIRDAIPKLRKLSFKFKDLHQSLILIIRHPSHLVVYFPLVRNPSTYDSTANEKLSYWVCNGSKDPWAVTTGCMYEDQDLMWQFLANLTVVRVEFDLEFRVNREIESYLRSFGVVSQDIPFSIREETVRNIVPQVAFSDISQSRLSFKLKYLLFCMLSHGYTTCFHLSPLFLRRIQNMQEELVEFALTMIYKSQKHFCATPERFEDNFDMWVEEAGKTVLETAEKEDTSSDSLLLRRILVTPSTVYFTLPSRELSNRVTRQYASHLDRFLRLSFVDERLASLASFSISIKYRIEVHFLPVFRFFDREYELLSFSSSQLRAGSLWLFANLPDLTVRHIRAWLGDFSAITNPAKYSARVGQCFSNSKQTIDLQADEMQQIPDITVESNHKKYTMSDGAGTISQELAISASNEYSNWKLEFGGSIQIRIGGIKGVVSIDPRLSGRKLCYRESMLKFPSAHRGLEILNFAQFRYGYLNRQIILLLSTLGVEDRVFERLQNDDLGDTLKIFENGKELKRNLMVADQDESGCPIMVEVIQRMIAASISPESDPFLHSVAQAVYNRKIMELRQKQRIRVANSACLMGVLDETGTLTYGQTYICIRNPNSEDCGDPNVITGFVAVTKNPCFHPGDVRRLEAIDREELRHHTNVVVFPSKGPRPHPNEISGSDLDGDLYFVTWEPSLVPSASVEAMDYTATGTPEKVSEMTSELMKDFFLKFISSDNLGIIANSHLALADQSERKAWDEKCLQLAKMHSTAVDFAKTGVSDQIPKELRPKSYPDFMENKDKESYKSEKIIGVLYRKVKDFQYEARPHRYELGIDPHEDMRHSALLLYSQYQSELRGVMNIFNIRTEAEVLTGEVAKFSKFYSNNQKKRREETRSKLKDIVMKLMKGMNVRFKEMAGTRLTDFAQECLYVAYSDLERTPFPGFPWVVAHSFLLNDDLPSSE